MKRELTPYHLGATLYLPANHKNLFQVACEGKYKELKSIIIDFEDALDETDIIPSQTILKTLLKTLPDQKLLIFIRPRSVEHLSELLTEEHIHKIDGFVLAKCDTTNMQAYFSKLQQHDFWIMPVLESYEIFDKEKIKEIKAFFTEHKSSILSLRFGGEDLSSKLGIKRQCEDILYDFHPLKHLLSTLILEFKPQGFNICAAVYTCFSNDEGLQKEVREDLKMGLFGKTVIHPKQIALVHQLYKVSASQKEQAERVSAKDADAILAHDGMMLETVPHRVWAKELLLQEEHYGLL